MASHDFPAVWDMYKQGTAIGLQKGTVISLDEVGLWDGVDRIHVSGKSQTLYIDNHYYRYLIRDLPGAAVVPAEVPDVLTVEDSARIEKERQAEHLWIAWYQQTSNRQQ